MCRKETFTVRVKNIQDTFDGQRAKIQLLERLRFFNQKTLVAIINNLLQIMSFVLYNYYKQDLYQIGSSV